MEPRWKGLDTAIPVAMVSKRSYSALVAEAYAGGSVTFSEHREVCMSACVRVCVCVCVSLRVCLSI